MAKPDWLRILDYFRSRPDEEINAYNELVVNNLHILEYTGRISDARKQIGCNCGRGNPKLCSAKEHIINTRKGYYKYVLEGRAKGETSKSRPSPSFEIFSISKSQAMKKTQERIEANPNDEFYQKLLNWQKNIQVSPLEEQVAESLL